MLKQHGSGDIIVMAENVQIARAKAIEHYHKKYRPDRFWFYERNDPDDAEMLEMYREILFKDLKEEPCDSSEVIFIEGSS